MVGKGSHTLLVVRQSLHAGSLPDIPQFDHLVVGARDYLWLIVLHYDTFHNISVTRHRRDLSLGAHVPETHCRVTAPRCHNVE